MSTPKLCRCKSSSSHKGSTNWTAFTDFYGYWTESAVKAFQAHYAADILYPIGLTVPTGKWASMSIKRQMPYSSNYENCCTQKAEILIDEGGL